MIPTIAAFIITLILGRVLPWNFAFTVSLLALNRCKFTRVLGLMLILGWLNDLGRPDPFGLTSALYLIWTTLVYLTTRRWQLVPGWWWLLATLITQFIWSLFFYPYWLVISLIGQALTTTLFILLNRLQGRREGIYV